MVTQSQGLISQAAIEAALTLLRVGLDAAKKWKTPESHSKMTVVEFPDVQERLHSAIVGMTHALELALDAPRDVVYIEELNEALGNLVQCWKTSGVGNEKA